MPMALRISQTSPFFKLRWISCSKGKLREGQSQKMYTAWSSEAELISSALKQLSRWALGATYFTHLLAKTKPQPQRSFLRNLLMRLFHTYLYILGIRTMYVLWSDSSSAPN